MTHNDGVTLPGGVHSKDCHHLNARTPPLLIDQRAPADQAVAGRLRNAPAWRNAFFEFREAG